MPLYKRKFICDCGNNLDRDHNSAINHLKDTVGLTEINACGDAVRPILARVDEARTIFGK